jgi:hypothetical protein
MTSTSQDAVQIPELGFSSHDMGTVFLSYVTGLTPVLGSFHPVDSLPLESNGNPVVDPGRRASASSEEILPIVCCENASVPRSLGDPSGEPHYGRNTSQVYRVPEATSQTLSQSSSGIPQPLNTSSAEPSGQGASAPDISIPSETPAPTRNEGILQITDETLLQEVDPERGPTTGGIRVVLFGENFPAGPLFVCFGDSWVRAVSYAQYHYPFRIDPKICDRGGTMPVFCDAVSLHQIAQVS